MDQLTDLRRLANQRYLILLLLLMSAQLKLIESNQAPNINYSNNMRVLKLPSSTRVGSIIYRLKGSDPDSDTLTFGCDHPVCTSVIEFKSCSFTEADVILKSSLERPDYNFTFYVTDGKKRTQVESTILVTKRNESAMLMSMSTTNPVMMEGSTNTMSSQYLFEVKENAPPNTTIGTILAKDKDSSNLPVTFELRGSDKFSVRYVFGPKGVSKGQLVLIKELDYERQNLYLLTILAMNSWTNEEFDTRNVITFDVLVAVKDVQDTPPIFVGLPNIVHISQDVKVGDFIVKLKAVDGDTASDVKRNISYLMPESQYAPFFITNPFTGEVWLKKSIDELTKNLGTEIPFLLPIVAIEQHDNNKNQEINLKNLKESSSTEINLVFVIISSKNHPPKFTCTQLLGSIDENALMMSPVKWEEGSNPQVIDGDPGVNGTIYVWIENDTGTFTIQPNHGSNELTFSLLVRNNTLLDYEAVTSRKIHLNLIAKDGSTKEPLSHKIPCIITINDVNDHIPQFTSKVYTGTIYEDSPMGTVVTRIKAFDKDSGRFGKIKFTRILGELSKNFNLYPESGEVTLKSNEGLDREVIGNDHKLIIEAVDDDGHGNVNTTELIIKLLDSNDNEPKFLQSRYDAILNPDMKSFTQPLIVKALDADEPGSANSKVTYEIIEGNFQDKFRINSTSGEIRITSPLVIESLIDGSDSHHVIINDKQVNQFKPVITLKVRAHDDGIPYKSSLATIYVHNKDFLNRSISFVINENSDKLKERKDEIEKSLSKLTGAQVNIHSIKPNPDAKGQSSSIVQAWVSYPVQAMIDLRNINNILSGLAGDNDYTAPNDESQKETDKDVERASIIHNFEYHTLVWILLLLVLITLLFVLCFCCIWCACCRKGKRSEFLQEVQSTFAKTKEEERTHFATSSSADNLMTKNQSAVQAVDTIADDDYRASGFRSRNGRVKRQTPGTRKNGTRTRIFPVNEYENAAFEEDLVSNPSSKRNLMKNWRQFSHSSEYDDNEATSYEMKGPSRNRVGHGHGRSQTTEIMYIRSPPEVVSYDEAIRSVSEMDDIDRRTQSGQRKSAISNKSKSMRQVSFNVDTIPSPSGAEDDSNESIMNDEKDSIKINSARGRSASNETLRSAPLDELEEIESDSIPSKSIPEFVSKSLDLGNGLINGPLISGLKQPLRREATPYARPENGHVKFITRLSLPGAVDEANQTEEVQGTTIIKLIQSNEGQGNNDVIEDAVVAGSVGSKASSDSDSGIGRSKHHVAELNLKNANLMEKKSIFTIAYDNVQPQGLPPSTAESRLDSAV